MSENPTRRQFSAEFKRDAVDLTEQPGQTSTDVAHQLGIRPALLQRWRQEARARGELAFPGAGKQALEASPAAGDCPGLCTFRWQRRESVDYG